MTLKSKIYLFLLSVFSFLLGWKKWFSKSTEIYDLEGELIVTDKNEVHIKLEFDPEEIVVMFDDDFVSVPCNPHGYDSLEWFVTAHKCHYDLVIRWNVTGVRSVYWRVS